jgi:protein TonB
MALRNIGVTDVPAPEVLPGGVYLSGGPGVNLPQVVKEVKPNYTREAMEARVQGFVLLECVVGTDGGVSAIEITRSLDQKFGLDQEAIKAASRRFKPGTLSGRAVPVMVTMELTFTLGSSRK